MKGRDFATACIAASLLLLTVCAGLEAPREETSPLSRTSATSPAEGPSAGKLLESGRSLVEEAQDLREERSPSPAMGGVFSWPPERERYLEYYEEAAAAFRSVLERYPSSIEASESMFMLGLINDHPHLNNFGRALETYRRTMQEYPGTSAAQKARLRAEVLEQYLEGTIAPGE